jgi:hypothetical protein
MPVGQEHHQRVTVTMPVGLSHLDQPLDLVRRQVFASPKLGIWGPARCDCAIYSAWRDQAQVRVRHDCFQPYLKTLIYAGFRLFVFEGFSVWATKPFKNTELPMLDLFLGQSRAECAAPAE